MSNLESYIIALKVKCKENMINDPFLAEGFKAAMKGDK